MVPEDKIDSFIAGFESRLHGWSPFEIHLGKLLSKFYLSNDVEKQNIFYEVLPSQEMNALNQKPIQYQPYIKSNKTRFSPHLSLAYDDVSKPEMDMLNDWIAGNPLKLPPTISWFCDTISLYHKPDNRWRRFLDFHAM